MRQLLKTGWRDNDGERKLMTEQPGGEISRLEIAQNTVIKLDPPEGGLIFLQGYFIIGAAGVIIKIDTRHFLGGRFFKIIDGNQI